LKQGTDTNYFDGNMPRKRSVIEAEGITESNQKGLKKLYEELVLGDYSRPINLKLLWEKGLAKFKETLGIEDFYRLMAYYGIDTGVGKVMKGKRISSKDAQKMVDRLRTIENAACYIDGYEEILEHMASLLYKAPEDMTVIAKAKLVRMFHYCMSNRHFFLEDYEVIRLYGKVSYDVTSYRIETNNKRFIYPESLIYIDYAQFRKMSEESLAYEIIVRELNRLQKKHKKLMLDFAGLKAEDGTYISVNSERCYTYGEIRNLKVNVNSEISIFPIEVFVSLDVMKKLHIPDMYYFYKFLQVKPLSEYPVVEYKMKVIEGSRYIEKPIKMYEVQTRTYIAGEVEKDRFIYLFDFAAREGIDFPNLFDKEGKVLPEEERTWVSVRWLKRITSLAREIGFIDDVTPWDYDFYTAFRLSEIIGNDRIGLFTDGIMSDEEAKEIIAGGKDVLEELDALHKEYIAEAEEEKVEEVEPEKEVTEEPEETVTAIDVLARYAKDKGYIADVYEGFGELVTNVIADGMEDFILGYANTDFDSNFDKKLNLNSEYAPMFFSLESIDAQKLENQLLDWKHSSTGKKQMAKHQGVVKLYCYIVENDVPCGPRKKKVGRNKALKPQILRQLIA